MSDADMTIEVYGNAYLFEETVLHGWEEVCVEESDVPFTFTVDDTTIEVVKKEGGMQL